MNTAIIIPAAGLGQRMGEKLPKQYLMLGEKPLICHTLDRFRKYDNVVIAVEPQRVEMFRRDILAAFRYPATWQAVAGGETRQASVRNALECVDYVADVVVIHDGVRPFLSEAILDEVIAKAKTQGAAIVAVPMHDTVKQVAGGVIEKTLERKFLWRAQTPQAFRTELFRQAMQKSVEEHFQGTDEASLVERLGHNIVVVMGDEKNIKITSPQDLALAEALFLQRNIL